jgi:multidrug efflux pump subunit AcrA (membrane-fusion protein)
MIPPAIEPSRPPDILVPSRPVGGPAADREVRPTRWIVKTLMICALLGAAGWYGLRLYRTLTATAEAVIPVAKVQRGDVSLAVTARGDIRGGNSEVLTAPLTGGTDMHITYLRGAGEAIKEGDIVVQFDTTEQDFNLREAEADLAEADQHILQASAQREAEEEEDRYALLKARSDIDLAELEVRKNPILPAITAKQNTLALDSARDHLAQLERNLANRKANNDASIAIQAAGRGKAESQGKTARQNIEAMTLRAHRAGYVALHENTSGNILFFGMTLPLFQLGDAVRPGMAVAEIPDLRSWELSARIGELDRGHLAAEEKVAITVIAVPNRSFSGHVKEIGGTTGNPWDRHFDCKIAIDDPSPELRPGMSAMIVVTTEELHDVLWLPAQALFESDGRTFVYVRSGESFTPKDVSLVRRNESKIVISGLTEGQDVALANPAETAKKKPSSGGAMPSLTK